MKKMLMLVLAAVMLLSMTAAASAETFRVGVSRMFTVSATSMR